MLAGVQVLKNVLLNKSTTYLKVLTVFYKNFNFKTQ